MIGPHQSSIWSLHRDGARRGRVQDAAQARQVVSLTLFARQPEHAHEHRRYELRVGHPVLLDEFEALAGIELLHHHDRGADPVHDIEPTSGAE